MRSVKAFLFLAVILLVITQAAAWGPKTREYFCKEALSRTVGEEAYVNCFVSTKIEEICSLVDAEYRNDCINLTVMPWDIPDEVFRDKAEYHDYSMCPLEGLIGKSLCGKREDTPAKEEAEEWFIKSKNLAGECKKLYAFCIGADYYTKRFFQPYQIKIENTECEDYFKSKVDEKIGSVEDWSVRGKCSYEYWEPRAGQSKLVAHSPEFVVNRKKVESILGELVDKVEEINVYEGGVKLGESREVVQTTTTLVVTTTTSTTTTTTTIKKIIETTTTTLLKETTTSTTTVATILNKTYEKQNLPNEVTPPEKSAGVLWFVTFIALVFLAAIIIIYISLRKKTKKSEATGGELKPRKRKVEHKLRDIRGVNRVTEDRLKSVGVDSLQKLISMDIEEIVEKTGISTERIISWKKQAEELLRE